MLGEKRDRVIAAVGCCILLVVPSCSDDAGSTEDQSGDGHSHSHDLGVTGDNFAFALGKPGDGAASDRTVVIEAAKGFRFAPKDFTVSSGETVTFEVKNTDKIEHELVLGNKAYQELHENQVKAGGVYADYSAHSVHVSPGDTASFTWTFEKAGSVLFACHVEGHYDEGMIGRIAVS